MKAKFIHKYQLLVKFHLHEKMQFFNQKKYYIILVICLLTFISLVIIPFLAEMLINMNCF